MFLMTRTRRKTWQVTVDCRGYKRSKSYALKTFNRCGLTVLMLLNGKIPSSLKVLLRPAPKFPIRKPLEFIIPRHCQRFCKTHRAIDCPIKQVSRWRFHQWIVLLMKINRINYTYIILPGYSLLNSVLRTMDCWKMCCDLHPNFVAVIEIVLGKIRHI